MNHHAGSIENNRSTLESFEFVCEFLSGCVFFFFGGVILAQVKDSHTTGILRAPLFGFGADSVTQSAGSGRTGTLEN